MLQNDVHGVVNTLKHPLHDTTILDSDSKLLVQQPLKGDFFLELLTRLGAAVEHDLPHCTWHLLLSSLSFRIQTSGFGGIWNARTPVQFLPAEQSSQKYTI